MFASLTRDVMMVMQDMGNVIAYVRGGLVVAVIVLSIAAYLWAAYQDAQAEAEPEQTPALPPLPVYLPPPVQVPNHHGTRVQDPSDDVALMEDWGLFDDGSNPNPRKHV